VSHLIDNVLPKAPFRQWVTTFPYQLRFWLATNRKLTNAIHKIVSKEIMAFYERQAEELGISDARHGGSTFIQRFGSACNLNVHFHSIVIEGVYSVTSGVEWHSLGRTPSGICGMRCTGFGVNSRVSYVEVFEIAFPADTLSPGILLNWTGTVWGRGSKGSLYMDDEVVATLFSDRKIGNVCGAIFDPADSWIIASIDSCGIDPSKAAKIAQELVQRLPCCLVVCVKDPDDLIKANYGEAANIAHLVQQTAVGKIPGFAILKR
jgi:hypothetical protein